MSVNNLELNKINNILKKTENKLISSIKKDCVNEFRGSNIYMHRIEFMDVYEALKNHNDYSKSDSIEYKIDLFKESLYLRIKSIKYIMARNKNSIGKIKNFKVEDGVTIRDVISSNNKRISKLFVDIYEDSNSLMRKSNRVTLDECLIKGGFLDNIFTQKTVFNIRTVQDFIRVMKKFNDKSENIKSNQDLKNIELSNSKNIQRIKTLKLNLRSDFLSFASSISKKACYDSSDEYIEFYEINNEILKEIGFVILKEEFNLEKYILKKYENEEFSIDSLNKIRDKFVRSSTMSIITNDFKKGSSVEKLLNELRIAFNLRYNYVRYKVLSMQTIDAEYEFEKNEFYLDSIMDSLLEIISKIIYYLLNELIYRKKLKIDLLEYITSKTFAKILWDGSLSKISDLSFFLDIEEEIKREKLISRYEENPVTEYKETRMMERNFCIHVGPTNSGKTYQALEDLKKSTSGMYLAPLRLLAIEVQDNLESCGVRCNLITGEEEIISEFSSHISATVEKADYSKEYDVVVIDEVQMIGDRDRGGSWTNAIMGIRAKTIHICTSPSALNLITNLINMCDDKFEIIEHTRNTELIMDKRKFESFDDCKKGDALIVFSKKNVLTVASMLMERGIKSSIIYGSLPYTTRRSQMERFLNGETDVVVTTDAISMGLNLPIERVVFIDYFKYDGYSSRPLYDEEVRQIAGRAGRYGIYDTGYVNAMSNYSEIKKKLNKPYKEIKKAKLNIPISILEAEGDLASNIKTWKTIDTYNGFEKVNVDRVIEILNILDGIGFGDLGNNLKYSLATMYFDNSNRDVLSLWIKYVNAYFGDLEDEMDKPKFENFPNNLYGLESYYKSIELYYTFSKSFGLDYDKEWIKEEKSHISEKINNLLISDVSKYKRVCSECGKELEWNSTEVLCLKCAMEQVLKKHSNNGIKIKRA